VSKRALIIPISCPSPGCGVFIATVVRINGTFFLHVPPFLIKEGQSRCQVCGRVFHWNGRHVTIEDLRSMAYVTIDK